MCVINPLNNKDKVEENDRQRVIIRETLPETCMYDMLWFHNGLQNALSIPNIPQAL